MIFGASNHPVEVKKILLRLWALRDEIELELSTRLATNPNLSETEKEKIIHEVTLKFTPHKAQEVNIDPGQALKLVEDPEISSESAGEEGASAQAAADSNGEETKNEENSAAASAQAQTPADSPPAEASTTATADPGAAAEDAAAASTEAPQADPNKEEMALAPAPAATIELRKRPSLPAEKIFRGILLLSDVNMQSIALFSTQSFIPGQNIVIEFDIPYSFVVSAEVISCRKYSMKSKIISQTRPDYRVFARFTFSMPGERTQLRKFVKSIEPALPKDGGKKKKKKEAAEAGDGENADGGEDLSNLGA